MLEQNTLVLGIPHGGELKEPMARSIASFLHWDAHNYQVYNSTLSIRSPLVEDNRNLIARTFLDVPGAKWLLFIDHDMEFSPDKVYLLLEEADEMEKRILTGLYFGQILNTTSAIVPMWFGSESEEGYHIADLKGTLGDSPLQPLVNCGAGFLLIHKTVLEEFPDLDGDPWRWFGRDLYKLNGKTIRLGEDMTFGRRAEKLGISMWGHNGCTLTHYKEQKITLEAYIDEQKRIIDRSGE